MSDDFVIHQLLEASKRGNDDQVRELLDQGEDIAQTDSMGNQSLHWAASGGHVDVILLLLSRKANINAQNQNGDTPLHKSTWRGMTAACQALVDAGADVDIANKEGKTPLALARNADVRRIVAPPVEMAEDDEYDEDSD
mmetsp:Transcript_4503/g.12605  ORF Transcript_4503/g.12605 Transcript_4503/m.12605 type:complete len:139 (-) Transcript_4503:147-563(-)|eukprot:CAMPEP_0119122130 /NCGR_PEP_ID=MMETSP1310-20130426/2476_1 /TAXON_ID=464262 /ORGANISM="Genus nov. species nov., Strain RCC2339" /LENGTH=138 /DNA_ID=CAMNT_0007111741 /DNA_START=149 /DNA_END=565 /DNA_ORIENTATION=-